MNYYTVVWATKLETLIKDVNLRLSEGWVCVGGIAVKQGSEFYQALTRFIKRNN